MSLYAESTRDVVIGTIRHLKFSGCFRCLPSRAEELPIKIGGSRLLGRSREGLNAVGVPEKFRLDLSVCGILADRHRTAYRA